MVFSGDDEGAFIVGSGLCLLKGRAKKSWRVLLLLLLGWS